MHSDLATLKALITSDIGTLVRVLFNNRPIKADSGGWRVGRHGSLSIKRDGIWFCHESGRGGDVFDLISFALACDTRSAIVWARLYVGEGVSMLIRPIKHEAKCKAAEEWRKRRQRSKALAIWSQSQQPLKGGQTCSR